MEKTFRWNYTQEFTNDSNPFGPETVWTCGSYTGSSFGVIGGPFAPFSVANQIAQSDFGSGCAASNPGGILGIGSPNPPTSDNLPGCFYIANSAGCTLTGGNDDSTYLHPGEGCQNAVVEFTAPYDGVYNIEGSFQNTDTSSTTGDVYLNGAPLGSPISFSSNNPGPSYFSTTETLTTGDTLDFIVGCGTSTYASDTTRIVVNIAYTGPK